MKPVTSSGARWVRFGPDPEVRLGDVPGQHAGVVAGPVDGPGVGRHAVLLEALRALPDRPREVDPGHLGALPPRRLDGQATRPERPDTEVGQVLQRADEAGRGDGVVDLDRQVRPAVGAPQVGGQAAVVGPLDPVDGRVQDVDPAAQHVILVRLDVARPDADQRLGLDRQARPGRRREDDLARPRQQPGRELEARVLLADEQDAVVGVRLDRAHLGVVVGELHAQAGRGERLRHTDGDDQDLAAIAAVRRVHLEDVAVRGLHAGASRSSDSRTG